MNHRRLMHQMSVGYNESEIWPILGFSTIFVNYWYLLGARSSGGLLSGGVGGFGVLTGVS